MARAGVTAAGNQPNGQTGGLGPEEFTELMHGQIIATIFGILAYLIAIATFYGFAEQAQGTCPDRDYSYLGVLVKLNVIIVLGVAAYFVYASYVQYEADPERWDIKWVLWANIVALGVVAVKLYIIYQTQQPSDVESEFIVA